MGTSTNYTRLINGSFQTSFETGNRDTTKYEDIINDTRTKVRDHNPNQRKNSDKKHKRSFDKISFQITQLILLSNHAEKQLAQLQNPIIL